MTIKIKGSIPEKILNKYQEKNPIGTMGTGEMVSIDTPNFDGNRTPKATALSKYLQRSDGFVWALFGAPLVAEYPTKNGTEKVVIDGGHRVSMLQSVYPDVKEYPATIVQVESKEKAHQYFHRINGTSSSKVTAECRFINEVLGKEINKTNDNIINVLKKTDIVIWESDDNFVPLNSKANWKITIKPMEEMVKLDKNLTVNALNLYTNAFGQLNRSYASTCVPITAQIVKGLHQLLYTYRDHFAQGGNLSHFENWFCKSVQMIPSKDEWLFKTYKHDRMEQRHLGTAYGIMKRYASSCRTGSLAGGVTIPRVELIENVYNAYDNKQKQKQNI